MRTIIFLVLLFVIGACVGSFLCCQARRLRLKELNKKPLGNRSVCMNCRYQLKWYDNIPIFSWLFLKGKCRKCHHKIGSAEILSELGLGLAFVGAGFNFLSTHSLQSVAPQSNIVASPLSWGIFIITLLLISILTFLAIYDGLYGELPTLPLAFSIITAVVILVLEEWSRLQISSFSPEMLYQPLLSVLILGGTYLFLYLVSKGRWVGDGDWLLGTAIGIVLHEPWLALLTLFLANFIACITMYPTVKKRKNHHIYFGPFLVIAFVIAYSFANLFKLMI